MKTAFVALSGAGIAAASKDAPVAKVLSMISELEAKIITEGQTVQKQYEEFSEWCEDRAANVGHEIKTGQAEVEDLSATISEETARIGSLEAKVETLSGELAKDESDLKAATEIRNREADVFAKEEKDLAESVDMLQRALAILEREMQGGASMLQMKNANSVVEALQAMVQASLINMADASKLTAFVQSAQKASDDDDDSGAPAAAVYSNQSGGVVDTIRNLLEKSEDQLAELRNTETTNHNNFQLMQQSLKDEIRFGNQDLAEAKAGIAASNEKKSTAEGDLSVTKKELAADVEAKSTLHHDCMTRASEFEAETKSRGEELRALAEAKKIITEATSLSQVSFVQVVSELSTSADLANYEVVRMVRDLARKDNSAALAQLASRVSSAMHSRDPFGKIKGLISDMIDKLESEADADATEKTFCDKELRETNEKKDAKTAEIEKQTTRIDQSSAKSATLKEEIATLQSELASLAKSQAEMNKMRAEEKATFDDSKAELDKAIAGMKAALKVLNEYYAKEDKSHNAAEGAGSSVIGLLEVCEADFSKDLAQTTSDEESAVAQYEQQTKENEIEKNDQRPVSQVQDQGVQGLGPVRLGVERRPVGRP
jgi:chromosome segregation ATPase